VTQTEKRPTRHRFILNPFPEERFASCPKWEGRVPGFGRVGCKGWFLMFC